MRKIPLFVAALAVAALLESQPSRAYYDGAWCAVMTLSPGGTVERCEYNNLESYRLEMIAGNRGFCRRSSYWRGSFAEPPMAERKAHKRRHRH
jgi:hypothetical protein